MLIFNGMVMSNKREIDEVLRKGWQPANEGYRPLESPVHEPTKVNGGYQPTTNKAPSKEEPAPPPKAP